MCAMNAVALPMTWSLRNKSLNSSLHLDRDLIRASIFSYQFLNSNLSDSSPLNLGHSTLTLICS